MRYELVDFHELGSAEHARWREIQRTSPQLASPYFSVEFARCVAAVRNDVRVCILEDDGNIAGFFPFQRNRMGMGAPIGGVVSDYHGLIAGMDLKCDMSKLLESCRLLTWEFDHVPAEQRAFMPHHRTLAPSPAIDVSGGYDSWCEALRKHGSGRLAQLQRKGRKLARELGPLRFEARVENPAVLRTVVQWKSEQCRRTGAKDFFVQLPWTRALTSRIWATRTHAFQGILSALWAGDHLMAAHFGMHSERVLHWWFPVYNRDYGKYSPGAILLLRVAEFAAQSGLVLLDLGKGNDAYKGSFANCETMLAEGYASAHPLITRFKDAQTTTKRWLRTSAAPLRPAWRAVRHWMRPAGPAPA